MRKLTLAVVLSVSVLSTSCLGSFNAWNGLKDWNETATDNKFANNAIFWALNIIPVYGVFYLGDVLIFNLVEFWSGDNPIAMKEGEMERQVIEKDGVRYALEATKNQMKITVLSGEREGNELVLVYEPADQSWNAVKDGETIKLSSYEDGFYIVYLPNGEEVRIDQNANQNTGLAILNSHIADYEASLLATEGAPLRY